MNDVKLIVQNKRQRMTKIQGAWDKKQGKNEEYPNTLSL